jgi:hypothetical protein
LQVAPPAAARLALCGLTLGSSLGMLACGGEVVTLGSGDAEPAFGDPGQSVRNLNQERNEEYDPTLTDDLLDIFFISDRIGGVGGKDVWHAARHDRKDPFDPPTPVVEASSPFEEASVAVSGDGLTLWVGSRRAGGLGGIDIWRTRRSDRRSPWDAIEPVEALNSPSDDLPRPPGQGGTVMPMASDRDGSFFQTFFATLGGPQQDLQQLDAVSELWEDESSMEDGFLTDDGLHLFFRRAALGQGGDLYVTWRTSTDRPFGAPISLGLVNSLYDDRDPFVSADRSRFFFASNRRNGITLDIYATRLNLPTYR